MTSPFRAAIIAFSTLVLVHTPVIAADTSWMLAAKYGVFLHYQHRILLGYSHGTAALGTKAKFPPLSEMTAEGWNRFVDGFADQMAEGQVGWACFCDSPRPSLLRACHPFGQLVSARALRGSLYVPDYRDRSCGKHHAGQPGRSPTADRN